MRKVCEIPCEKAQEVFNETQCRDPLTNDVICEKVVHLLETLTAVEAFNKLPEICDGCPNEPMKQEK